MPATEQTKYNLKSMHVIFGLSALIMLFSTLWMFAANQDREWKGYQRTFRSAEERLTKWQIQDQQSRDIKQRQMELERQSREAKLSPPQSTLYAAFKSEVELDAEQRADKPYDFTALDTLYERLEGAANEALVALDEARQLQGEATQARDALIAAEAAVDESAADPDQRKQAEQALTAAQRARKKRPSATVTPRQSRKGWYDRALALRGKLIGRLSKIVDLREPAKTKSPADENSNRQICDAAKAVLDLLVRDERPQSEQRAQQKVIDQLSSGARSAGRFDVGAASRRGAPQNAAANLTAMTSDVDGLQKKLADSRAEYDRLLVALEEREVTYWDPFFPIPGKRWLEMPILDAFNSPLKIDNLWTEGLTIKYGSFSEVRRFDRCTTCHKGIDKTAPGTADQPAYPEAQTLEVVIQTPDAKPQPRDPEAGLTLQEVYGFRVAATGMIDQNQVAVAGVDDRRLAAVAAVLPEASLGQQAGDGLASRPGLFGSGGRRRRGVR